MKITVQLALFKIGMFGMLSDIRIFLFKYNNI